MQAYFWVFDSIPLINLSISIPIPYSSYYYCSVVQLEIRDGNNLWKFFYCFSFLGFFVFPYEVQLCSLKVCKVLLHCILIVIKKHVYVIREYEVETLRGN